LPVPVKWLAVKTASEMTYTVSGGALNSTQTKPNHSSSFSTVSLQSISPTAATPGVYTAFPKVSDLIQGN